MSPRTRRSSLGLSRCNKGLGKTDCLCCPFVTSRPNEVIKSVKIFNTGQIIKIDQEINCKTQGGFLYLLWSEKCPEKQYLGSCLQEPRDRLGQHRRDILNVKEGAVPEHFRKTNSKVRDLVFVPFRILKNNDTMTLKDQEYNFIKEFKLVKSGINRINGQRYFKNYRNQ